MRLARAYTGTPITWKEALRRGLSRIFPLMGGAIIAMLLYVVGFLLCVVPGLFALVGCFAFVPAVMLERRGPVESISRSFDLVKGGWGETFLVLLVVYLIVAMPTSIVMVLSFFGGAMSVTGGSENAVAAVQAITQVIGQLLSALTTPFSVAAVVLLYYDRRVRTEALDVQMMAESLATPEAGAGPAAAPGWG